jgi:RNA polymerase sigma-70 factor (ECF subfamily)
VNIQSFDVSRRFSPWIYRIAHNEFVNAVKKRKKDKNLISMFYLDILFPHPIAKEAADDDMQRKELRAMLDTSLDKINERYREPLTLYYYDDMDYKEIAEIMRVPVSTVGVWLQRGRAELKKMIDGK